MSLSSMCASSVDADIVYDFPLRERPYVGYGFVSAAIFYAWLSREECTVESPRKGLKARIRTSLICFPKLVHFLLIIVPYLRLRSHFHPL